MQPPSKQIPLVITADTAHNVIYSLFIIKYKHFNLLNLLIFIILTLFVTSTKEKFTTPRRWCRSIETCCSTYDI